MFLLGQGSAFAGLASSVPRCIALRRAALGCVVMRWAARDSCSASRPLAQKSGGNAALGGFVATQTIHAQRGDAFWANGFHPTCGARQCEGLTCGRQLSCELLAGGQESCQPAALLGCVCPAWLKTFVLGFAFFLQLMFSRGRELQFCCRRVN